MARPIAFARLTRALTLTLAVGLPAALAPAPALRAASAQEPESEADAETGAGRDQPARSEADRRHWLVTASGERIETHGPWRVEGRRILFRAANGSLTSIRTEQVDLAASRAASDPDAASEDADGASPAKPLPAATEKPLPRLVLTEEDLPPMTTAASADPGSAQDAPSADAEGAARAADGAASATSTEGLEVVEWRNVAESDEPLQIYGTVRNQGPRRRDRVSVVVKVYDEGDNQVGNQPALLQTSSLNVGQSTSFRVTFPAVRRFERVEIEMSSGSR